MAKSITRIDAKKPDLLQRKRVAAYARVSMDTERLMHSLSVQVSYYSELIQNTPGWEYAGVYADEGITGTKMDSRPEFIRMLADCEAGKIDIILTKSLSRFARNTVDAPRLLRPCFQSGFAVQFPMGTERSVPPFRLCVDQFRQDHFFRLIPEAVHQAHPGHLIPRFQFLRRSVLRRQFVHHLFQPAVGRFLDLQQVALQLAVQDEPVEQDRALLL